MNRVFLATLIALTLAVTTSDTRNQNTGVKPRRCTWALACENPNRVGPSPCCYGNFNSRPDPMKSSCSAGEKWKGVCKAKDNIMTGCWKPSNILTPKHLCWKQCYPGSGKRCTVVAKDGGHIRCKRGNHDFCANTVAASMACRSPYECRMHWLTPQLPHTNRARKRVLPPAL